MSKHAFTQIPNHYLDLLKDGIISANQFAIIAAVARWSNNKKGCIASTSYFSEATQLSKQTIITSVDSLIQKDLISRFNHGNSFAYFLKTPTESVSYDKKSSKKAEETPKKLPWCQATFDSLYGNADKIPELLEYIATHSEEV